MSDELDLTEAIEAAARAVEAWQYIPDFGDGRPAIRMGSPEQVARVAVEAAAAIIAKFYQTGRSTESTAVLASMDAPPLPTGNTVVEHAQLMAGGGMHVRPNSPEVERAYPLDQWIECESRFGGRVFRRVITVVEDWTEVTDS